MGGREAHHQYAALGVGVDARVGPGVVVLHGYQARFGKHGPGRRDTQHAVGRMGTRALSVAS